MPSRSAPAPCLTAAVTVASLEDVRASLKDLPPSSIARLSRALESENASKEEKTGFFTKRRQLFDILDDSAEGDPPGVRLLQAGWIVDRFFEHKGPLPRRQDVEEPAFNSMRYLTEGQKESMVIVAVSYCWITPEHPDPEGYHLETLAHLLQILTSSSKAAYFQDGFPP